MSIDDLVTNSIGFSWDRGNVKKNWEKHRVNNLEAEEVFFNSPLLISDDNKHSQNEKRFYCLGQTNEKRRLFVSFTIRNYKIRVISARDQSKKERSAYEKA